MSVRTTIANTFVQSTNARLRDVLAPAYPGITDPHALGGTWVVRVDSESGKIHACVHVYRDKPFAYIDHLAASGERGHGLRLAGSVVYMLINSGYTRILANVRQDNELMLRAIRRVSSGEPTNGPYMLVDLAKEILA